jgi:hypothetical protein
MLVSPSKSESRESEWGVAAAWPVAAAGDEIIA